MIGMTQIRTGLKIEIDGEMFIVNNFQHIKPGKGQAFVRAKIKNLKTGQVLEKTFKQGDSIKLPDFEEKEMQYLYKDESGYHLMDNNTYDQTFLTEEQIGDKGKFLQENANVKVLFHKGEVLDVQLPLQVVLEVTRTEPGVKGDSAGSTTKPATLETGAVVQVPLFINQGERIKVDTRSGEYLERAKG